MRHPPRHIHKNHPLRPRQIMRRPRRQRIRRRSRLIRQQLLQNPRHQNRPGRQRPNHLPSAEHVILSAHLFFFSVSLCLCGCILFIRRKKTHYSPKSSSHTKPSPSSPADPTPAPPPSSSPCTL